MAQIDIIAINFTTIDDAMLASAKTQVFRPPGTSAELTVMSFMCQVNYADGRERTTFCRRNAVQVFCFFAETASNWN